MAGEGQKTQRHAAKGVKRATGSIAPVTSNTAQKGRGYERQAKSRYEGKKKRTVKQQIGLRWPQFVFIFVLMVILVLAGLFAWDRWFRYDDLQDFQGEWIFVDEGTSTGVVIDADEIAFAENVEYSYELNTWEKTISYTFGDLEGSGVYRFSPDRNTLVISENGTVDWIIDIQIIFGMVDIQEGLDPDTTTSLTRGKAPLADPSTGSLTENTPPTDSVPEDETGTEAGTEDPYTDGEEYNETYQEEYSDYDENMTDYSGYEDYQAEGT